MRLARALWGVLGWSADHPADGLEAVSISALEELEEGDLDRRDDRTSGLTQRQSALPIQSSTREDGVRHDMASQTTVLQRHDGLKDADVSLHPCDEDVVRLVLLEVSDHVVDLGGGHVLMTARAEGSAALFRDSGFEPVICDISEFEKLEGCVTCLSVRLRTAPASRRGDA